VFDLVDRDGGGSIDCDEVKELMNMLGLNPTAEEVEKMVAEIDLDGNGTVDFDEFLQVMAGSQNYSYTKKDLLRAFKLFAKGERGGAGPQGGMRRRRRLCERCGCAGCADPELPKGYITPEGLVEALVKFSDPPVAEDAAFDLVSVLDKNADGLINYLEKVETFMN